MIRTARRNELAAHLSAAGIQTGIHYPIALPKLAAYAYLKQAGEPIVANQQDSQLLSLPMGEPLSNEQVLEVIRAIKDFFRV